MGRKTGLCSTRLARKSSDEDAANDTDRGLQANLQSQAGQGLVGDEPSHRCGGFCGAVRWFLWSGAVVFMERCGGFYGAVRWSLCGGQWFFMERR